MKPRFSARADPPGTMFHSVSLKVPGRLGSFKVGAMTVRILALGGMLALLSACASHRPRAYAILRDSGSGYAARQAHYTLTHLYPPKYRATQRAIITVGKRQYVCDGVLTASPDAGHHLAVISALGLVTELQVKTNRASELLRTTPLFREEWSRNFVARDLRWLFVPRADLEHSGRLADGRFALESAPDAEGYAVRYIFAPDCRRLHEVEVEQKGARVYHALVRRYRTFPGFDSEMPSEIAVVAPPYTLHLRTAELTVPGSSGVSTADPMRDTL